MLPVQRPVRFTPAAAADIEAIWDHTTERWGVAQAVRYVRALQATCDALGHLPGRAVEEVRPGYRKALSGAPVIFYRETAEGLVVVRILHARMDADRHL